ncbi:MAG: helix-turn-helix domain-containing protein [Blautia sp.]|nr:helix-turn-helix domain-containing protein [Blautia sp.]
MKQSIFSSALDLFTSYTKIPIRHYTDFMKDHLSTPSWMPGDCFDHFSTSPSDFEQESGLLDHGEMGLYGYVHDQTTDSYFIAGPVFRNTPSEDSIEAMIDFFEILPEEQTAFRKGIHSLPTVTDIQFLTLLNAILNFLNFRIARNRTTLSPELTDQLFKLLEKEKIERYSELHADAGVLVDVINEENAFLETIRNGDTEADQKRILVKNFNYAFPSLFSGQKDLVDLFIVVSTLISRAAIDGGMEKSAALFLQRAYIRKSKDCETPEEILALQIQMAGVYTMQVRFAKDSSIRSHVVRDAVNYINLNLSSQLTTQEIANALMISRGHLSNHFKKETGQNISNYILMQKTKEAQRLLLYTNMSIAEISDLLSFSSQSHFTSVFKKYSGGATPTAFRNNKENRINKDH